MDKRLWVALLSVLVLGMGGHTAWAESSSDISALKKEVESLKQGQKAMQKDLNTLKDILRKALPGKMPFKPVVASIEGSPVMGNADAPVTMIEYTDFQCPFCRRYSNSTFAQIVQDYVKTGKVRYVVRQFPLKAIHPKAVKASEASLCAGDQDKYWEMHDRIFKQTKRFEQKEWIRLAEGLELEMSSFTDCLNNGMKTSEVDRDIKEGSALGMRGTPGFFFGRTDPDNPNKFKAVEMIRGAFPYTQFKKIIEKLLKLS